MQFLQFRFPWLLTAIHTGTSAIGSYAVLYVFKLIEVENNTEEKSQMTLMGKLFDAITMIVFSVLYTVNIAISNVSLNMVSLPFHQIVRSTNPAVTVLLERTFLGKRHRWRTYISLVMVAFNF